MAVTSGFYNSDNGDRRYSADQMSALFEGVFADGVFKDYPASGDHFTVTPGTGMSVVVGPGRAWFNKRWIDNSADVTLQIPRLDSGYLRKDCVVLVVNKTNASAHVNGQVGTTPGRSAAIDIVCGSRAQSNPEYPVNSGDWGPRAGVRYYVLAYIDVSGGDTQLLSQYLHDNVGTSMCPFAESKLLTQGTLTNEPLLVTFSGANRSIHSSGGKGSTVAGHHYYAYEPTVDKQFAEVQAAIESGRPVRACWVASPGSETSSRIYVSSYNYYLASQPTNPSVKAPTISFWYSWVHSSNWDPGERDLDIFGALHITWFSDGTLKIYYERFGDPYANTGSRTDYDLQGNSGTNAVEYEGV